ncbi:MAG: DivIVA domain-containing protein [Siphonobacter sp.]
MNITPLDIRKHSFERVFRGYDKDSVDAFLSSLSQEWEKLLDENKLLRERLERTESDFSKLKALENTLYKTLQTAQQTSHEMVSKAEEESQKRVVEATQQAEQSLQSVRKEAEEALQNARKQSGILLMEAENKARYIIEEALNELKGLERDCKAMEKYKEILITQIKGYATDALEKVQRFEEKSQQDEDEYVNKVSELNAVLDKIPTTPPAVLDELPQTTEISTEEKLVLTKAPIETTSETEPVTQEKAEEGSFFDSI